ncbi:MAG: efflux RND transporter periplasmic adaptor subunit [Arcobacter sp.]|nr:efflux RND transporter periplasmic adaptor subunit [Arcobacter sp.]
MIKKLIITSVLAISSFAMGGPSLVETTKLTKGEVNPLQEFIGTLNFNKKSTLAAQNSGLVKFVNFELGDKVKKGKVLVQIDSDVLNAQIKAVKANLKVAKQKEKNSRKNYQRYKKLLNSKSITQKEYDDALLKSNSSIGDVKVLEAKLKELKIQSNKKSIKAPFDGIIAKKSINLGEWVNAGTPIAKIINTYKAEFIFNVPLKVVNGLKKGDIYDINVGNKNIKSELSAIIPNGDKLTRTFPIKFISDIKDSFVFDGQQAKVRLSKDSKKEGLLLPRDSVIKRFGQNVIFFIDDKMIAKMIPVQVVGYVNNNVAVSGKGLVPGMQIVLKGNERIFPNSPVKIINK